MPKTQRADAEGESLTTSLHTFEEILQQPLLWPDTVDRVRAAAQSHLRERLARSRVLLTGAGTSAYAAEAIAAAWPGAVAIPTTDLLVDLQRYLSEVDVVISLARSGNSPESAAVVQHVRAARREILQLAIICNEKSALSESGLDGVIVLDPRTNDRSLVMTSSFSNLVLAGLTLAQPDAVAQVVSSVSNKAGKMLAAIDGKCKHIAADVRDRVAILASSPFHGWCSEAGLKLLEMTAGRFPILVDTYLGLRHGPMSFVKTDTLVLCLLSSDPVRRLYEEDLIRELRTKKLGRLVGIDGSTTVQNVAGEREFFDEALPAVAPDLPDELRTPFEIVIPQFLGLHLSLRIGLNPDNPSPEGIINRVVQGVRIHPATVSEG